MCERRNGVGTTGQAMGRETVGKGTGSGTVNIRDGNKTPFSGTVDCGNRNQGRERSGNRGRERSITRFPVPAPTIFSCLDLPRVPLLKIRPK